MDNATVLLGVLVLAGLGGYIIYRMEQRDNEPKREESGSGGGGGFSIGVTIPEAIFA